MRILGVDPGFAIVGCGIVDYIGNKFSTVHYSAVTTKSGVKLEHRLKSIYDGISDMIDTYKPDCLAVEELFFNTNAKTAIQVGQARGVILLAAEKLGVPVFEYTPMQVKQAVVGYGAAQKRQVMLMTQRLLGMKEVPKPDDAADALAIAICHSRSATSLMNTERVFDANKYDTR